MQPGHTSPTRSTCAAPKHTSENNEPLIVDPAGEKMPTKQAKQKKEDTNNDDPPELYDSDEDEKNEAWVEKHLTERRQRASDAVLNCPACFGLLTMDCQQHEVYHTQFRSMFVHNCNVDKTKKLIYGEEIYHPVFCKNCGAQVAVFDKDEVYHFFDVIPSYNGI